MVKIREPMNILITTIPHDKQRYPTVGDWEWFGPDQLNIRVSDMGNWKYEVLVALHEAIEVLLCKDRDIKQLDVDEFDIEYEKNKTEGDTSEPGDHPDAPYKNEHFFATSIERLMAAELGVDWGEYEKTINSL